MNPGANRFGVLALLFAVYTFNFLDRQILGILAAPIKAELELTDTQLGLLGGIAFALFYTGLGIPIAWLADRRSRAWIITIAFALWSAFTAACGLATNFAQLFLMRMGVGVGEAGGVAPSYSLIADYFPPKERARAFAVYSFGIPIGGALGVLLGGVFASLIDWRWAFFAVGAAGLLLAPIFRWLVREPARGRYDPGAPQEAASFLAALAVLSRKPSFWLMSLGAASSSVINYGSFFWIPSFLMRSYHLPIRDVSYFFAAILLIGGIAGIGLGGVLGDRLGARSRRAFALIPAVAFLLAIPFSVFGVLSPSPTAAFLFLLVPTALGLAWLGPVITAQQHLVAPHMRATASAIYIFIVNLIGLGLGTVLIGALSDGLTRRFGAEALRYSLAAGSVFYLVAAILFLVAARFLPKDWRE
jgi:predicted MFS family arabinose efflux permease